MPSFPFTYLGLPLGTTKLKIEEFALLLDRVERKLTACSARRNFNVQPNSLCVLCYDGKEETIDHLFF